MLILLAACSGEPEHSHHAPDLRERASRALAPAGTSRFDRWLEGDETLNEAELEGLDAFLEDGCAHCHAGPELSGEGAPPLRGPRRSLADHGISSAHEAFLASLD